MDDGEQLNFLDSEYLGKQVADKYYKVEDLYSFDDWKNSLEPKIMNLDQDFSMQSKVFNSLKLAGNVDLGEVLVNIEIEGSTKPIDASSCHIYFKREYFENGNLVIKWEQVIPKDQAKQQDMSFTIYPSATQKFSFVHRFKIGKYTAARLIFFGVGFITVADQMATVTPFEVVTTQIRIKKPMIEVDNSEILSPDADGKLKIPFTIKYPAKTWVPYGGWWAMAKGGNGDINLFRQVWVKYANQSNNEVVITGTTKIAEGPDPYWYNEGVFVFDMPTDAGIYNLQFGLFDNNWKDPYNWIWPGSDIQVGGDSWIQKCPPEKMPPRLRVKNGKFVKLDGTPFDFYEGTNGGKAVPAARGASWGNAYGWTNKPALNNSGFFGSLRYMGHKWIRFMFNPDSYTEDPVYRNRVLDSIHKILIAGAYPLAGMHNMHVNVSSVQERDKKFFELIEMLANDWKGLPVLFPVLNEPKELNGWDQTYEFCKKACEIVRSIDPDAFLIVPCKGYSKTITTDEANKLLPTDLVDLYSYHPYNKPQDVLPFMKPLLDTGVGVMVEEYGCGNLTWFKALNIEMQKISKLYPNFLLFGTWAWTIKGQDGCPLVADASKANMELTESGNMVYTDMKIWDSGNAIDESGTIAPPVINPDGNVDTSTGGGTSTTGGGTVTVTTGYTKEEVNNLVTSKMAETKESLETLINDKIKTIQDNMDNKLKLLSDKIDSLTTKVDEATVTVPFQLIQQYITELSNCKLASATISPTSFVQLQNSRLTVSLTTPAPKGGAIVYISPTINQISIVSFVLIPEGETSRTIEFTSLPITSQVSGRVSCTFNGKTISPSVTIRVK